MILGSDWYVGFVQVLNVKLDLMREHSVGEAAQLRGRGQPVPVHLICSMRAEGCWKHDFWWPVSAFGALAVWPSSNCTFPQKSATAIFYRTGSCLEACTGMT